MSYRLDEKVALVTGGNQGIGLATAKIFVDAQAKTVITDITHEPSKEVVDLLKNYPERIKYFQLDVTKLHQIVPLLNEIKESWGCVDILFNNAAIFGMAPLLESDEKMYDKLFTVNVKGMFFVMQKVLLQMVENRVVGSVINLASQAGRRGEALVSHYCATKAAVISYTQSAALSMAPYKIRVNAIAPGVIDTPMWKSVDALFSKYENLSLGEKKKQVGKAVPLGYMGYPVQIAKVALFLASDSSDYITAQTINVDGGNVMS